MKLASIDIGTNSMRLLITDYENGFSKRKKYTNITRIGRGVDEFGYISKEAIDRNIHALKEFVEIAKHEDCEEIYVMGTSALRDSKNKEEFIERAKNEAGVSVDIISGNDEASLGFYGVTADLKEEGQVLILDIGGGSTEFILGDKTGGIVFSKSENIGSVRLTEKFIKSDPVDEIELENMDAYIKAVTENTISILKTYPITKLIGIGGTATTISAMVQQLDVYDMEKVHQSLVMYEEVEAIFKDLKYKTLDEKRMIKGLQPQRADVITAGVNILKNLMSYLEMKDILISEYDNLEGLVYTKNKN